MPQTPHIERHFTCRRSGARRRHRHVRRADRSVRPGGRTLGRSGNSRIVVIAGLAEIAAGSIAMGLGGYLAAKSDAEHYDSERPREVREVQEIPEEEAREVQKVFADYGLSPEESGPIVAGAESQAETVGGFHDALRIGTGGAGSQARPAECLDHRRLVHCRWNHSPVAVHDVAQRAGPRSCGR